MRSFNKIFVVALPRCATVSMCQGLGTLGIRLAHLGKIFGEKTPPHDDPARLSRMHAQIAANDFDLEVLRHCDGLIDYPACIPKVFQGLDRQFPGSLFINVRRDHDVEAWLQSVERQFVGLQLIKLARDSSPEDREFMRVMRDFRCGTFGQADFDAKLYRQAYRDHQASLVEYFRHRPQDFLDIPDISILETDGFRLLGEFFRRPVPNSLFPRVNDHSDAPRLAFMQAIRSGLVQSQTGIEIEIA